jgi:hypothetical protein
MFLCVLYTELNVVFTSKCHGCCEAWLQLICAPLALRVYGALPPEPKSNAVQDFTDIFSARLFPSAVALYQTAAAAACAELLNRTCRAPDIDRELFRRYVTEKGLQLRHPCYPSDDKPAHLRE